MQELLVSILLSFSTILGVKSLPQDMGLWKFEETWVQEGNDWILKASTEQVAELCKNPDDVLSLPQVIHGIHKVFSDGKLVYESGDDTFKKTSSFYQRGSVSCRYLAKDKKLVWTVKTYSQYFARISAMPYPSSANNGSYLLDVVLNLMAAGSLFILSFFSVFLFKGRVSNHYVVSLAIGSMALAFYSALTSANYLGIQADMLTVHKVADVCVWIGSFCYVYFFRKFNFLGRVEFYSFVTAFLLGEIIIISGSSADVVQMGTTLPMPFAFICLISFLGHSIANGFRKGFDKNNLLGIISLTSFVTAGCNDLLHVMGVIDSYMLMPLGSVFGVFFLAAAVNQEIEKTYLERDDLVVNLKEKVADQTKHLSDALEQVKKNQVDLVESARLASLGTLSAGIAHEINNAINYVNGAVIPLERKVMKSIPENEKVITEKLFAAIKEGTHLTVEIVRSLRNFTGLNQAKVKDVNLRDSLNSVLVILKSKLAGIEVVVNVDDILSLNCYQVGLNQIFMNLISNAVDVLPAENGKISISAKMFGLNDVELRVSDNGCGMSPEVQKRIFDAFYTTKEVGKGTGLGLHIVQKEVERHSGTIKVVSVVNEGTTFIITMPKNLEMNIMGDAA
jgi:signal transduction histidine kinase